MSDLSSLKGMRIALVHDWLTGMRGGEKVLEVLCELFPDATIFTLLHNPGSVSEAIERHPIRTSFIQRLPMKAKRYRNYLPLMPLAIEMMDFTEFDLIVSTSHAVAKGAHGRPGVPHICYCHTPMRYVWEQFDEYFAKGRAGLLTRAVMALVAPYLRCWDVRTQGRVDHYIANSHNVAGRIHRIYGRTSDVIPAPVDTRLFKVSTRDDGYYLIVSALVPYKRVDLAVDAFNRTGDRLVVVGTGPEKAKLEQRAKSHAQFVGWQSDAQLADWYAGCRALIFPGEEDFGIVPLEAMASGKPVIAYAKGGALETVSDQGEVVSGVFFREQTMEALLEALEKTRRISFQPEKIRRHAERFDREMFRARITKAIAGYVKGNTRT